MTIHTPYEPNHISPFQGLVSWRCQYSEGRYRLAGISCPYRAIMRSPEGARYANDGHRPSGKASSITSPEGA